MNKDNGILWSPMHSLIKMLQKFLNSTYLWTFLIFFQTELGFQTC